MRKFHIILLILSAAGAPACRHALPEDRLVDLLADMYLYDEELTRGRPAADSVSIYRSVFVAHGCTEADYRAAIARYAEQPNVMKRIYETVKARLERRHATLEHALRLENYRRDCPGAPYDTLRYMTPEADSAAARRVFLVKFRQAALADTAAVPVPVRPAAGTGLERAAEPQPAAPPDAGARPALGKPLHPVHPGRPANAIRDIRRTQFTARPAPVERPEPQP
jgi:hypothetical protein